MQTIELRKKGYSINEIARIVPVSKSTISLWCSSVVLGKKAKDRIDSLLSRGQVRSRAKIKLLTQSKTKKAFESAATVLNTVHFEQDHFRILCSMVYFCEGAKSLGSVNFTNSDPQLIGFFLFLLRKSFKIKESKLRVLMHLHDYHNEEIQKDFWSNTTSIPKHQFQKTYLKQSNHLYRKDNYQGCVVVRYYDTSVARDLNAIAKITMERYK